MRLKFREKRKAIKWAKAAMADPNLVFIGIEATGKNGDVGVVDLALVAPDGTVLVNAMIDPEMEIEYDMSALHGIYKKSVVNRPRWMEIHRTFSEAVGGKRVIAWNQDFVRGAVRHDAARYNLTFPYKFRWEDAMKIYSQYRGNWSPLYKDWRADNIENACKVLGLTPPEHRALAKAMTCREIVKKLSEL